MTGSIRLSAEQLDRIRALANVLLPGTSEASSAQSLADFDDQVQRAVDALHSEDGGLGAAIDAVPEDPSWASVSAFADDDPAAFDEIALIAVGAYFMSPSVLASLGLPTGERRPADREQAVDELSSGVLDAVLERGCPVRTLEEVNAKSSA